MGCHDIMTDKLTIAGQVCVSAISENGIKYLKVAYNATDDWVLVSTETWISDDYDLPKLPRDENGEIDFENFPYFVCNSTGQSQLVSKIDLKWEYNCEEKSNFTLVIVSHVTMAQLQDDGTIMEDSEVTSYIAEQESPDGMYGWFNLELNCDCPQDKPCIESDSKIPRLSAGEPVPSQPAVCIEMEDNSMEDCHDILAGDSMIVGKVCTSVALEASIVDGEDAVDVLKVNFTASNGWAFVSNEIWVGEDIATLPVDESGDIDTENFPYFW